MTALFPRPAALALFVLALAACGDGQSAADDSTKTADSGASLNEMVMGNPDAKVTVIEYASWTCPACLQFQGDAIPVLKEEYVKTGKVKFIFREFPTPPANISIAGFAVARCAGDDKYFDVLDELFDRQQAILSLAREGGQVKAALQEVALNNGIESPEAFEACLMNSDIRKAIAASVQTGDELGIHSTPTVLLNGEILDGYEWRQADGLRAVLDEALGEDAPAPVEAVVVEEAPTVVEEELPAETETDTTPE